MGKRYYVGSIPVGRNDVRHYGVKGMKWGEHIFDEEYEPVGNGGGNNGGHGGGTGFRSMQRPSPYTRRKNVTGTAQKPPMITGPRVGKTFSINTNTPTARIVKENSSPTFQDRVNSVTDRARNWTSTNIQKPLNDYFGREGEMPSRFEEDARNLSNNVGGKLQDAINYFSEPTTEYRPVKGKMDENDLSDRSLRRVDPEWITKKAGFDEDEKYGRQYEAIVGPSQVQRDIGNAWNSVKGFSDKLDRKVLGDDVVDYMHNAYTDASNWVSETANKVGEWATKAVGDIGKFAGDAINAGKEFLDNVGKQITEAGGNAFEAAKGWITGLFGNKEHQQKPGKFQGQLSSGDNEYISRDPNKPITSYTRPAMKNKTKRYLAGQRKNSPFASSIYPYSAREERRDGVFTSRVQSPKGDYRNYRYNVYDKNGNTLYDEYKNGINPLKRPSKYKAPINQVGSQKLAGFPYNMRTVQTQRDGNQTLTYLEPNNRKNKKSK